MNRLVMAALVTVLGSGALADPQNYPTRPITIVVPVSAGGPTDAIARTLAERMRTSLGQPVLVENVTGAAGNIGVGRVARSAPDGYTIGIGLTSTHVFNGAIYALPFDLVSDFEPIAARCRSEQKATDSMIPIPMSTSVQIPIQMGWTRPNTPVCHTARPMPSTRTKYPTRNRWMNRMSAIIGGRTECQAFTSAHLHGVFAWNALQTITGATIL